MGNPAVASPGFENHGTYGINVIDQTNALALLRVKNIEATTTSGFSTFSHALRSGMGTGLALDVLGDAAISGKFTPATSGVAQRVGVATLVAGTVTVNTTAIITGSFVFTQLKTAGGTVGNISYTQVNGTSITFTSDSGSDTGTFNWWIMN